MMRLLRVMAVDDEQLALRRLELLLQRMPGVALVGTARSGPEALDGMRALAPDVLLLDVRMAGMSGIDLVHLIDAEHAPLVIFVTAFDRFAAAAFDLSAVDYVVKPVEADRLQRALERARERLEADAARGRIAELQSVVGALRAGHREPDTEQELWVQRRGEFVRLSVQDIDWVEAERDYVRLHAPGETYLIRHTLSSLHDRLGTARFLRIRRSALVQADRVAAIRKAAYGDIRLKLHSGRELRIGRTYYPQFRALLEGGGR
jgi:DNA-binding LytR/AlgR family response regulator